MRYKSEINAESYVCGNYWNYSNEMVLKIVLETIVIILFCEAVFADIDDSHVVDISLTKLRIIVKKYAMGA